MRKVSGWAIALIVVAWGCGGGDSEPTSTADGGKQPVAKGKTYAEDVAFLREHVEVVELGGGDGPALVVVPAYQGRVMTSTFDAAKGDGIGFIKYDVVEKGEITPGMTAFGGEDRIWLGPEGGQFSIFFNDGEEQNGDNWQTPAVIDSEAYDILSKTDNEVTFRKSATLKNTTGTEFKFEIDRTVALLGAGAVANLGVQLPETVKSVAYESRNTLKNTGDKAWTHNGGLLSIWILSMYKHSQTTRVVVPYETSASGKIVKDDYFGKVPEDRLVDMGGFLVFNADGQMRTKIGLPPQRAKEVVGSWDPGRNLLTIVQYNKPEGVTEYVNSQWAAKQDDPFAGDVVNSYNDGPFAPGKPAMGPFYEIETSSPALALKAGDSYTHVHRTFHFTGPKEELEKIAMEVLGVDLDAVSGALP
jgi:hypothetical protein